MNKTDRPGPCHHGLFNLDEGADVQVITSVITAMKSLGATGAASLRSKEGFLESPALLQAPRTTQPISILTVPSLSPWPGLSLRRGLSFPLGPNPTLSSKEKGH